MANALDCEGLKKDILALEYQIQNSKVDNCEGCKTRAQLTQEYNKLLADLVIAEGLVSLGLSIEGHHNSLNDLTPKDISKATESFEKLENSLESANLLHEGLKFKNDTTIFSRYDGKGAENLKSYLKNECKQGQTFSESDFCKTYKASTNKEPLLETLSGFLDADKQLSNGRYERIARYEQYQSRLTITSGGSENQTPNEFKNSSDFKKVKTLVEKINEFKRKMLANENTDSLVEEIMERSKELKEISVSYSNTDPTGKTEITEFIRENFNKVLSNFDLPKLLEEGNIQKNLINTQLRLKNDIKLEKKSLGKEIAMYLAKRSSKKLNGVPLSTACAGDFGISCLEKICGVNGDNKPDSCENFEDINFNEKYKKYLSLENLNDKNNNLSNAHSCFNIEKLEEERACLETYKTNNTPLSKLRDQLKEKKVELKIQSKKAPFPLLNQQKALALSNLNSNYCRQKNDLWKFNSPKVDCVQSNGIDTGLTALNLGFNGEEALIKLETTLVDDAIGGLLSKNKLDTIKKDLLKECKKGSTNLKHLCKHYLDENKFKKTWQDMIEAKQNVVIVDTETEDDGVSYSQAFEYAAATSILPNIQTLIMSYAQTSFVNTDTKFQLRRIDNYDTMYMKALESYRQRQELLENNAYLSSYGYTQNSLSNYTNFQYSSSLNNTLYGNSTPFNFAFTPIQPVTVQTGTSTTSSSNNVFSFKF